ncbi:zf-HC2 domain-containing protein [Candidatus Merdisoma sp. JLR.KK011]|uniref:zf-HC2 domain-containing protein n=1 Tax=Candidatus Merdisoma sp. JLR.KK011 TaxID=3114299 RepID=UPI002FF0C85C
MKHNISCALARDLAPLYAENLVSGETRGELEAHLETCESCRAYYQRITEKMEGDSMETARQEAMEIDYMKRIRVYQRTNAILGGIVSFLLGMLLPVGFLGLSVFVMQSGFSDYHWARLQLMWPIVLLRMAVSGIVVCLIYCGVNRMLRRKFSF